MARRIQTHRMQFQGPRPKTPIPEFKRFSRMIEEDDIVKIRNGDMDVYPSDTATWRVSNYKDCEAFSLRLPKDQIRDLRMVLNQGLLTVSWGEKNNTFGRRLVLGTKHDASKIKAFWRDLPVKWSDIKTELWIVVPFAADTRRDIPLEDLSRLTTSLPKASPPPAPPATITAAPKEPEPAKEETPTTPEPPLSLVPSSINGVLSNK